MWHYHIFNYSHATKWNLWLVHYKEDFTNKAFEPTNIFPREIRFSDAELDAFEKEIQYGLAVISAYLAEQRSKDYADLREYCKEKNYTKTSNDEITAPIKEKLLRLSNYMKMQDQLEKEHEQVKQVIFDFMERKGIDIWEFEDIKFTKVKESKTIGFDKKKFAKEHPAVYKQYNTKESIIKSYLKVKLLEVSNV